ncbi:hypothetical protein HJC23_004602 [Cyclotella cryptica]|uniref:J domain-containing protein n=1 Tax=Cyclotella cryptica TaxID=29204 RepID=A0ABD3QFG6_9STRA|eukprot:CCRYP_005909-RA/>CCRYP_005909-RA protein AED:0.41 eAED:0.41 QI:0/-1/0/1/-1/1/1/0/307
MANDSAFRRLLLDTVSTTIAQPPSSSALIELLRVATPDLLPSSSNTNQRHKADETVRNASQREKLLRTLQSRIHPDKHLADERATALFQEVTLFYERCVKAIETENKLRQQRSCKNDGPGETSSQQNDRRDGRQYDGTTNFNTNSDGSKAKNSRYPQWYPRNNIPTQNPRSPRSSGATFTTHSDYENAEYFNEQTPRTSNPSNGTRPHQKEVVPREQPSDHKVFAAISTVIFPPLGLCALYHAIKVRTSWNDGRYGDARRHSEKAYNFAAWGYLCFGCVFLYLWLSDGEFDWNWDRIKRNLPWDDGP